MRFPQLKVDIELFQQCSFCVPQRQTCVFQANLGLNLVALRSDQIALVLQELVGSGSPNPKLGTCSAQTLLPLVGRFGCGFDLWLVCHQVGKRALDL